MDKMCERVIRNTNELEFAIFCIENVAIRLEVPAEELYQAFTSKSDLLYQYIIPGYEMLHTQSKEYIVEDIIETMKEMGVQV